MDLFILLGSGFLGAVFMSSQGKFLHASMISKLVVGCGGGGVIYLTLSLSDRLPVHNTMSALLLLFTLGGLAGIICLLAFQAVRWVFKKR